MTELWIGKWLEGSKIDGAGGQGLNPPLRRKNGIF